MMLGMDLCKHPLLRSFCPGWKFVRVSPVVWHLPVSICRSYINLSTYGMPVLMPIWDEVRLVRVFVLLDVFALILLRTSALWWLFWLSAGHTCEKGASVEESPPSD